MRNDEVEQVAKDGVKRKTTLRNKIRYSSSRLQNVCDASDRAYQPRAVTDEVTGVFTTNVCFGVLC